MTSSQRCLFSALSLAALTACGDFTSSVGELGRLRYGLFTDFEVPESSLDDARIVTGHRQTIIVSLTSDGGSDLGDTDAAGISHRASPSGDVSISDLSDDGEDDPPDFSISVAQAGEVAIESVLDGEVFDKISLTFATPTGFDLILKTRAPFAEDFSDVDESSTISCGEGTQVTVDAAPTASGERLAGVMQTEVTVDPTWIAVPGVGVVESYENAVWKTSGQANFYFIEPGAATLSVRDPVSNATGSANFNVTAIPH